MYSKSTHIARYKRTLVLCIALDQNEIIILVARLFEHCWLKTKKYVFFKSTFSIQTNKWNCWGYYFGFQSLIWKFFLSLFRKNTIFFAISRKIKMAKNCQAYGCKNFFSYITVLAISYSYLKLGIGEWIRRSKGHQLWSQPLLLKIMTCRIENT